MLRLQKWCFRPDAALFLYVYDCSSSQHCCCMHVHVTLDVYTMQLLLEEIWYLGQYLKVDSLKRSCHAHFLFAIFCKMVRSPALLLFSSALR